jgi:ribonuclease Z
VSVREMVVLGTASQVPTRYRNHNGYLLLWDGVGVLFDPGEGTQRQMGMCGASAHQIHRICVTHFHGDHCLGLPGIIQRISLDEVPHPVHVHYPASGQRFFERLRRASIFLDRSDLRPMPVTEEGLVDRWPHTSLHTARLDHAGVDTWGWRVQEDDGWRMLPEELQARGLRGPAIGRLLREGSVAHEGGTVRLDEVAVRRPGQSVAFLMDTRPCPAAVELARGVDLLVCESTYLHSEAVEAGEHGHMTSAQAGQLAAEAGARRLLLTHFSRRYPMDAPFVQEAGRFHPDVIAATDFLRVEVPRRAT